MQALLAIALHTFRSAIRFRLLPVLGFLLLLVVVVLPMVLQDDETSAQGYIQLLLSYTLYLSTGLLAVSTLWIACGSLARDLEEHRLELVDVKPVPRWKVWVGKWLGIMLLDAVLLSLAGAAIYFHLHYQARHLPESHQRILREQIFVARASARMNPPDLDPAIRDRIAELARQSPSIGEMPARRVREMVREEVQARYETVPPGNARRWTIPVVSPERIRGKPLHLRVKFRTNSPYDTATYPGLWRIGPPETQRHDMRNSLSPGSPIQFEIPPDLVDAEGNLHVDFINFNEKALVFPLEDGLEVLYHRGGMAPNFVRGLLLIYCWLGLLAAMGLMAASFLSFPVAAFFSCGVLLVAFSTGTLDQITEQGGITGVDSNTGRVGTRNVLDDLAVGVAGGLLRVIGWVLQFSPVGHLSEGRWISPGQLALCVFVNGIVMGGLCALTGIVVLGRRELATVKAF